MEMDLTRERKEGFSPILPTAGKGRGRKKKNFLYIVQRLVALPVPRNHPQKNSHVAFIMGKVMVIMMPSFFLKRKVGFRSRVK